MRTFNQHLNTGTSPDSTFQKLLGTVRYHYGIKINGIQEFKKMFFVSFSKTYPYVLFFSTGVPTYHIF